MRTDVSAFRTVIILNTRKKIYNIFQATSIDDRSIFFQFISRFLWKIDILYNWWRKRKLLKYLLILMVFMALKSLSCSLLVNTHVLQNSKTFHSHVHENLPYIFCPSSSLFNIIYLYTYLPIFTYNTEEINLNNAYLFWFLGISTIMSNCQSYYCVSDTCNVSETKCTKTQWWVK